MGSKAITSPFFLKVHNKGLSPMKKQRWMQISRTCLHCIVLLSLLSCTQPSEEEQIQLQIKSMQAALENKKSGALMDFLHPNFSAQKDMTRDQLQALLALNFLKHKTINVTLISTKTAIDPVYDYQAETAGTALITGADRLLPKDGRLYSFSLAWQKEGDDWLLKKLAWE
ncbi:MAG: nuclear transport factor 2 family protein [Pseudomonadales bacterium]|nr:nuclear transport factor 2 family protein [Pseudomonadales bacterium]